MTRFIHDPAFKKLPIEEQVEHMKLSDFFLAPVAPLLIGYDPLGLQEKFGSIVEAKPEWKAEFVRGREQVLSLMRAKTLYAFEQMLHVLQGDPEGEKPLPEPRNIRNHLEKIEFMLDRTYLPPERVRYCFDGRYVEQALQLQEQIAAGTLEHLRHLEQSLYNMQGYRLQFPGSVERRHGDAFGAFAFYREKSEQTSFGKASHDLGEIVEIYGAPKTRAEQIDAYEEATLNDIIATNIVIINPFSLALRNMHKAIDLLDDAEYFLALDIIDPNSVKRPARHRQQTAGVEKWYVKKANDFADTIMGDDDEAIKLETEMVHEHIFTYLQQAIALDTLSERRHLDYEHRRLTHYRAIIDGAVKELRFSREHEAHNRRFSQLSLAA